MSCEHRSKPNFVSFGFFLFFPSETPLVKYSGPLHQNCCLHENADVKCFSSLPSEVFTGSYFLTAKFFQRIKKYLFFSISCSFIFDKSCEYFLSSFITRSMFARENGALDRTYVCMVLLCCCKSPWRRIILKEMMKYCTLPDIPKKNKQTHTRVFETIFYFSERYQFSFKVNVCLR